MRYDDAHRRDGKSHDQHRQTFPAPAAAYSGCCMDILKVDTTDTITLDANTNFKTIGGGD